MTAEGQTPESHPHTVSDSAREKLAARLRLRPDRSDLGQVLPLTAAALALPSNTVVEAAARARALTGALGEERLVIAVEVEATPRGCDSRSLSPEDAKTRAEAPRLAGQPMAFTSVEELGEWDPKARPATLPASQVAAAALSEEGPGVLMVNPASTRPVLLPRACLLALAGGGRWLPAWEDEELHRELREAAHVSPAVVGIGVRPGCGSKNRVEGAPWDGTVAVDVFLDSGLGLRAASGNEPRAQGELARALHVIGSSPRLREAAQRVELVPRPTLHT